MGCVNTVKTSLRLMCCDKFITEWQSKALSFKLKSGVIVTCYDGGANLVPLSDVWEGRVDGWCPQCKKSTEYFLENKKIVGSRVIWYDDECHIENERGKCNG